MAALTCAASFARAQPISVLQFVAPNGQCESADTLFLQAESVAPFGIPLRNWSDRDFKELIAAGSRCIADENGGPSDSFARTLIDQFEGTVHASAANARGLQAQEAAKHRQRANALAERERRLTEREARMNEQAVAAQGEERDEAALAARETDQAQRLEAGVAEREKRVAELERQAADRTRRIEELQRKEAELTRREQQARSTDGPLLEAAPPQVINKSANRLPSQSVPDVSNMPSQSRSQTNSPIKPVNTHLSQYQIFALTEHSLIQCVSEFASYEGDRQKVSHWLDEAKQAGLVAGVPEAEVDNLKRRLAADPAMAVMQLFDKHKGKSGRKRDCDGLSANTSLIEIARRSNAPAR